MHNCKYKFTCARFATQITQDLLIYKWNVKMILFAKNYNLLAIFKY